jgi:hypothetical protein
MRSEQQSSRAADQQIRTLVRSALSAALLFCCSAALFLPGCGTTKQGLDEHRSPLNSEIGAQLFDKQVREFWSLGMTRDQVEAAGREARLRMAVTQDPHALREIDPTYDDRPALVARIIPPGIFINWEYMEASTKVGYLYFFFGEDERLRSVAYRLSQEQEQRQKQDAWREEMSPVRVVLPEGDPK